MENTIGKSLAIASERMKRMRSAKEQMAREVEQLMEHSEAEGLCWTGTLADLMEALYYAFEEQTITDDDGVPLPFRSIVASCCTVLHLRQPGNPYETASRARQRKGVKSVNYLKRYLRKMEKEQSGGLWTMVSPNVSPR